MADRGDMERLELAPLVGWRFGALRKAPGGPGLGGVGLGHGRTVHVDRVDRRFGAG
jgi:hypothetical protein